MKKTINLLGTIIFLVLFIACEKDSEDIADKDQTGLELKEEGTYYENGHYYRHLKVVESGNTIQVYVVADEPSSFCRFENRGELTSNPSTGFIVEGKWFKFYPLDTWCGSSYRIVQQKDNSTIVVRAYSGSYESAYNLGTSVTYKK